MRLQQMSKKGSTRVGTGRPSAGDERYEVYLGTGAEAKKARDGLLGETSTTDTSERQPVYLAMFKLVLAYI